MGTRQIAVTSNVKVAATPNYAKPLAIVTSLFFMWGFLTCLNDILIPHLKAIFDLSYARVMLIQFAFFSAYFLFSVPWSRIVNAIGYKTTMVVGLLTMALGAFLFIPAASVVSFPLFLTALLVLAAGITGLQVSANPYVDLLGKPETASSRLDLTQAFNSLGTTIAPKIGGIRIFKRRAPGGGALATACASDSAPLPLAAGRIRKDALYSHWCCTFAARPADWPFEAAAGGDYDRPSRTEGKRLDLASSQPCLWCHRNLCLRRC